MTSSLKHTYILHITLQPKSNIQTQHSIILMLTFTINDNIICLQYYPEHSINRYSINEVCVCGYVCMCVCTRESAILLVLEEVEHDD